MHVKSSIRRQDVAIRGARQTHNFAGESPVVSRGSRPSSREGLIEATMLKADITEIPVTPVSKQEIVDTVSLPSTHPTARTSSALNREDFTDPELSRPVAERQTSKQTIIPIRKPKGDYFRIHPSMETRLQGVTVLLSKNGKPKILTNAVSDQTRQALPKDVLKKVDLYLAVDERGSFFVTYFSASDHENAESWRDSGFLVVQRAENEWIAIDASMHDGGYRILPAKDKYPKLAASKPKWELPGEDDPVSLFEATINQNRIDCDSSPSIQKYLESRQ